MPCTASHFENGAYLAGKFIRVSVDLLSMQYTLSWLRCIRSRRPRFGTHRAFVNPSPAPAAAMEYWLILEATVMHNVGWLVQHEAVYTRRCGRAWDTQCQAMQGFC